MKKLMIAASAALCATVGFSDVTSANVVGYVNKDSIAGMNYISAPFINTTGEDIPLQSIQLDATVGDGAANIQRLDYRGAKAVAYDWYTAASAATKKDDKGVAIVPPAGAVGCWVYQWDNGQTGKSKKTYYKLPDGDEGVLKPGEAVQIWTQEAEKVLTAAGQVQEQNIVKTSIAGMNYVGNPYAAALPLQSIQLDESVGDGAANIQRLDYRGAKAVAYDWYTAASAATKKDDKGVAIVPPAGAVGCWVYQWDNGQTGKSKKTYYKLPDGDEGTLKVGEGIQLWTQEADKTISMKCPYDFKKND